MTFLIASPSSGLNFKFDKAFVNGSQKLLVNLLLHLLVIAMVTSQLLRFDVGIVFGYLWMLT